MKRYSSAPCLADTNGESKKIRSTEEGLEPNAREYLQLALARVLQLQREIKEGTYATETDRTSDLDESSGDEDITKEILCKVFKDLPGTPSSVDRIIERTCKQRNAQIEAIHGKRVQLLGYDTCRRATVDFMKNVLRDTRAGCEKNQSGFRFGTYSRNEPRVAYRRTGLLTRESRRSNSPRDPEIRERMLRSLDLHLAAKQRDYTAQLMRPGT